MKLEVEMYVRTLNGIAKITRHEHYWINKEEWNYITTDIGSNFEIDLILKASHNIIDLIEVGDYVNGHKVTSLWKDKGKIIGVAVNARAIGYDAEEIISIVTKEQFESMSYKVN